jgi:hypothetical protein
MAPHKADKMVWTEGNKKGGPFKFVKKSKKKLKGVRRKKSRARKKR